MPRKKQKRTESRRSGKRKEDRRRTPGHATPVEGPRIEVLDPSRFPVVGIGASAGGLEAFSELLHAMPADPGLAIVLIPHLAPQHESVLPVLLSGRTALPVVQANEGMQIEPNRVYVIPPNVQMGVIDGRLHLLPRPTDRSQYTPIDFFLRSLAEAVQDRSIAVILSGTASDGTLGIREIKAAGGIVLAQTPETARYDGMPRAAIATSVVDLVLSPEEIAAELVRIARHPVAPAPAPGAQEEKPEVPEEPFRRVLSLLLGVSGVDFTRYKRPTIERRMQRRMVLHRFVRIEQYLRYLHENPGEAQALYRDILIHVTRFFREPDSYESLKTEVFPKILEQRRNDDPIRVWIPGCSTGEESYSVGIALLEYLADRANGTTVQIFATDLSESAVEHARAGIYPESISADVSAGRLRRFFTKLDGNYRVSKVVRDLCVFARQDLTRDPPFSKLDLIVCRNVLIYMGLELQKRLMSVFHYALRPNGFLMLGSAETIGVRAELFSPIDKKQRIYEKKAGASAIAELPLQHPVIALPSERKPAAAGTEPSRNIIQEANHLIQDRFAPPGVVIDQDYQIIQFRGQTGAFLEPSPGEPSLGLLKMAREGLLHGLRAAVQEARRNWGVASRRGLHVKVNGDWKEANVHVVPLGAAAQPYFLVVFEAEEGGRARVARAVKAPLGRGRRVEDPEARARANQLEQELASSRQYLQSTIQELEAANEELQSANEEILSSNEELQSTNEELDTAKEELQSTNEELNTVNEELHARNQELTRVNSDLMNLLGSVHIAIVIVSPDLRIRRFTPMAEQVLNLIPSDLGRPIGHIKPNIDCPDLEDLIGKVVETVTPLERQVRDRQGNRLSLRIRPYKNVDNRIEGAVLALFDTHETRASSDGIRRAAAVTDAVLQAAYDPIVVLDKEFRVNLVNDAFCRTFSTSADEARDRPLWEVADGRLEHLRPLLENTLSERGKVDGADVEREVPGGRPGRLRVTARRITLAEDGEVLTVLSLGEPRRDAPAR